MMLQILWFILIVLFFTLLFVLEGFDYGVGIFLPFLGKQDTERRIMLNAIGPFWLGNEVWMVCGGGALFAAFPKLYATLLSGFYPLFMILLISLIARGPAIEFRSHHNPRAWRTFWDWVICAGSILPAFCWGVLIANLLEGVPLDAHLHYAGNILHILNPYAVVWGLTFVGLFMLHGALFLRLKVHGSLMERTQVVLNYLWLPVLALVLLLLAGGVFFAAVLSGMLFNPATALLGTLTLLALLAVGRCIPKRHYGRAFALTCATIVLAASTLAGGVFPHVLLSSLNQSWSLTIVNASSAPYTLTIISWFAFPLFPFMLLSQFGNYWIFKKRLASQEVGYY